MNLRDSELVMGMLLEKGFARSDSPDTADMIIFNTCSVRKHAENRLFNALYDLRAAKQKNRNLVIGVSGCTAQSYKSKILEKINSPACGKSAGWVCFIKRLCGML